MSDAHPPDHDRVHTKPRAPSPAVALWAPVVALLIAAVGYRTVLRPALDRQSMLRVRADAAAERAIIAQSLERYDRARAALQGIRPEDLAALTAVAPPQEDVPGLFAAIDAAAQRAGVAVASIEVTREDPPKELRGIVARKALAVNLGVRNMDYAKLKAFLDVLAASRRMVDVVSVQFTAASLGATIRARAYTLD